MLDDDKNDKNNDKNENHNNKCLHHLNPLPEANLPKNTDLEITSFSKVALNYTIIYKSHIFTLELKNEANCNQGRLSCKFANPVKLIK